MFVILCTLDDWINFSCYADVILIYIAFNVLFNNGKAPPPLSYLLFLIKFFLKAWIMPFVVATQNIMTYWLMAHFICASCVFKSQQKQRFPYAQYMFGHHPYASWHISTCTTTNVNKYLVQVLVSYSMQTSIIAKSMGKFNIALLFLFSIF